MYWKHKAILQNGIALLPSSASYATYYWIQRHFGGLRQINFVHKLLAGIDTWKKIKDLGFDPSGKIFFEIGTGRIPLSPLAYWLMGAKKIITIDLNPYLVDELIMESIRHISNQKKEIEDVFGPLLVKRRFDRLLAFSRNSSFSTKEFLDLCRIDYIAPGNAAITGLASVSIDFHTSYTVLEHIRPDLLKNILEEGNRIVRKNGLFIHKIDYSDHFSHSDEKISAINFLQYSDNEWKRYSGNRYAYVNRLRHDDFINLFQSVGHHILAAETCIDRRSQKILRKGILKLDERFNKKPEEILSVSDALVASRKG